MERQRSAPSLGRGFGSGDTIDLSSDLKKAKAVALLKGKAIPKASQNYVPSRKRKAEDMEKARTKVRDRVKRKQVAFKGGV